MSTGHMMEPSGLGQHLEWRKQRRAVGAVRGTQWSALSHGLPVFLGPGNHTWMALSHPTCRQNWNLGQKKRHPF